MDVCTIIAKNYVAQARVLGRSFAEHHPDGRIWALIIDDFDGFIEPANEPFEVLTPAMVGCVEFEEMAARYTVLELSTAVKPWLLRHLMAETGRSITYLDPDIRIYDSLEELDRLAAAHGIALIPHNTEPIPPDGLRPGQIDIMIAGVYNLGYVSFSPRAEVDRLLEWWADRLRRDCRVDPVWGYFVDQRWFDLVPGFMTDFAVVREPQYNLAYWNLHSRDLDHDGARYTVEEQPLAFFHFSGFDPERPSELSLHQNRLRLSEHPALARICAEYAEQALGEGLKEARKWPYGYGRLGNGMPFDTALRRMFVEGETRGELTGSPFDAQGAERFIAWLGEQQPDAPPGINRMLADVYGNRADLRLAYPDLGGPDLGRFLEWSKSHGRQEVPALAQLPMPEGAEHAMAWAGSSWRRNRFLLRRGLRRAVARARRRAEPARPAR